MTDIVQQAAESLTKRAEAIKESGKGYQAIVQEVIVMGGKAMLSKRLSMEQAEYIASAMIAAIAIAKESANPTIKPPSS